MSSGSIKIKRALLSVSDKTHLQDLANTLVKFNIELIASGGTYKTLVEMGFSVVEVSNFTKSPEMLDGRVKTLHPKIHGGILAIRSNLEHQAQIKEHGLSEIDLVVVSLYPFEEALQTIRGDESAIIEKIDIGGPSMIRSAAKNFEFVATLVSPKQYPEFIAHLESNQGATLLAHRRSLAKEAFTRTASFDTAIANYFKKDDALLPDQMNLSFKKMMPLRYGENPHQQGAFYIESLRDKTILQNILQGKQLSYNNIQDVHAGLSISADLSEPYTAVIIKHNNPCGVATADDTLETAYLRALECDPVSAFGGILVFNATVDLKLAEKTSKLFTEIIVAPKFTAEALAHLAKKTNLRLIELTTDIFKKSRVNKDIRRALDGYLVQDADQSSEDLAHAKIVSERSPTKDEFRAMDLAWKTSKHVKSNAIVIANTFQTLGIGAGQMNRLASAKLAAEAAHKKASPLALASDAFFPFRDNVDMAQKHGVTCIVQPGGSIKDQEVIDAANEHGIAMLFTGVRHFNH